MSDENKTPEAPPPTIAPAPPSEQPKPRRFERTGFSRPRPPKGPVRSLEHEQRPPPPSLRELDAEIESELAAALTGINDSDLLAATTKPAESSPAESGPSTAKHGKVLSVHGQDVFVDIPGGRGQGVLSMLQFPDGPPVPGTPVDVSIEGYDNANGLLILSRRGAAVIADWSSVAEGMTVEARVTEVNKGGLAVDINGIRGFMPMSQIDLYRVEQPEKLVDQRLLCMVTEVNPAERNLVVSRRALLEKEREEKREKLWAELDEGQILTGIVRSVREFGAFVDLGGVDGLIPISEMSWKRVEDPNQIVQPGQSVRVAVLRVDKEKRKVALGLKQLENNPWDTIKEKYHVSQVLQGKVTRTMDFGAFVELEPGVEGLVHVSELDSKRVWRINDVVKPDQPVTVKILNIDPEQRRISLSIKAAMAKYALQPEEEEQEEADAEPAKPPKPRTTPLRGGIGSK